MREDIAVKNLMDVKEVFERFDIRYWLDWGTLLGAVREGKIIAWDCDIDLGMMKDDLEKIILPFSVLERKGFNVCFWDSQYVSGIYIDRNEQCIGITPYRIMGKYAISPIFIWPKKLIVHGLHILYSLFTITYNLITT